MDRKRTDARLVVPAALVFSVVSIAAVAACGDDTGGDTSGTGGDGGATAASGSTNTVTVATSTQTVTTGAATSSGSEGGMA
jgi:hypothetical protein